MPNPHCRKVIRNIAERETCTRYAAGFEALRDRSDAFLARTGARPQALLLPLGPLAEHNIRTTFAANLLASGGIEAINPGTVDAARRRRGRRESAGSPAVAVICGTDKRYGDEAADIVAGGPKRRRRAGLPGRAGESDWRMPSTGQTST